MEGRRRQAALILSQSRMHVALALGSCRELQGLVPTERISMR